MGCFPCAGSSSSTKKPEKSRKNPSDDNTNQRGNDDRRQPTKGTLEVNPNKGGNKGKNKATNPSAAADEVDASKRSSSVADANKSKYKIFQYAELESATENFKPENLLGEGGFGKVHKGRLVDTGQIVAVKRLNLEGCQGIREFNTEIAFLSSVNHPNLVKLIGSCAEGDKRLLVYEYMPLRSLEDHLHGRPSNNKKLDWRTRMKIATGAAQGLEYLHNGMKPPIIHRDLKCANILLEEGYHPKLSDFGLAKVGPSEGKSHVSTRVMGTYGYCDPNYASTGQLTTKSDIYSFGVVLLEIVTGRKAIDDTKPKPEQNLVEWARPLFRDRNNFPRMADPLLEGRFPAKGIYQALAISSTCLHINPSARPRVQDVVAALDYLVSSSQTHDPLSHRVRISGESSSAANKPGTDDK